MTGLSFRSDVRRFVYVPVWRSRPNCPTDGHAIWRECSLSLSQVIYVCGVSNFLLNPSKNEWRPHRISLWKLFSEASLWIEWLSNEKSNTHHIIWVENFMLYNIAVMSGFRIFKGKAYKMTAIIKFVKHRPMFFYVYSLDINKYILINLYDCIYFSIKLKRRSPKHSTIYSLNVINTVI